MKRILSIGLLSFVANAYAGGNFFNMSGTSSSMTVSLNVPNHTYKSVGIKLNNGYQLSNAGTDCVMNSKGFCIFELSTSNSKTFSITGTGNQVSATICLNGNGPVSCQSVSYTLNEASYTNYVYVVNNGSNQVSVCLLNSAGALTACQDAGVSGYTNLQGIAVNSNGQQAYVTYQGSRSGATGGVLTCSINPSSKQLENCSSNTISAPDYPGQIAFSNAATPYVYFLANDVAGTSQIYQCTLSPTNCTTMSIAFPAGLNLSGLAVNNVNNVAYIVNNKSDSSQIIYNCLINPDGTFGPCSIGPSGGSVANNSEWISLNPSNTAAFIPSYTSGIYNYPIISGNITLPVSNSSSYDQNSHPFQALPTSSGVYAVVTYRAGGSGNGFVAVCPINNDNTFGTCVPSDQSFNVPLGVAMLPY